MNITKTYLDLIVKGDKKGSSYYQYLFRIRLMLCVWMNFGWFLSLVGRSLLFLDMFCVSYRKTIIACLIGRLLLFLNRILCSFLEIN